MARLGIDFGTSNTGAGILRDGRPTALPLEAGAQTLPTAVFVDFTDKRFVYGEAAARAMMLGLARLRGQQHEYAPTGTPVRVTYHPAYLLRSPREKAKSWADLKQVRQHLASDS